MDQGTVTFQCRLCWLFLFLVSTISQASQVNHDVLTLSDLKHLQEVFLGEFDNSAQNQNDTASGATGNDLHFLIQRFHVPVQIPSLRESAGAGAVSRQVYLEQYTNNGTIPRQRIFNIVLRKGQIEMESHQAVNASITEAWKNWRTNRSVFEEIGSDDLRFDPQCNVQWTRSGIGLFTSRIRDNNCVFSFLGQQLYIESEVNVTQTTMVQDERFVSVDSGTTVAGSNTPYVYDKVASFQPLPEEENSASRCYKVTELTCHLLKVTKHWKGILFHWLRLNFLHCFASPKLQKFYKTFC